MRYRQPAAATMTGGAKPGCPSAVHAKDVPPVRWVAQRKLAPFRVQLPVGHYGHLAPRRIQVHYPIYGGAHQLMHLHRPPPLSFFHTSSHLTSPARDGAATGCRQGPQHRLARVMLSLRYVHGCAAAKCQKRRFLCSEPSTLPLHCCTHAQPPPSIHKHTGEHCKWGYGILHMARAH